MSAIPDITLNDGTWFPELGLGTYNLRGEEGVDAIVAAIGSGYRLLDTAVNYENEREVGEAVRRSGVDRDSLLVASKIPGRHHGRQEAVDSVRGSLGLLGLDRIDLHLIHWPNPSVGKYVETWRGLIDAQQEGLVRSIGVSNFTERMIDELIEETGVVPAVNQVELHPYFVQPALQRADAAHGIITQAWSPIGGITFYPGPWGDERRNVMQDPLLADIAAAHGKTPAQVMLGWHLQQGRSAIPKSTNPARIAENFDVFDLELSAAELEAIDGLDTGVRSGPDPDVPRDAFFDVVIDEA